MSLVSASAKTPADVFCSAIVGLLRRCRPSTIVRRIWTVIVDAVQRASAWPMSHVSQERGEIVSPSFAHHDAATAVQCVLAVALFVASTFGVLPRVIFLRVALPVLGEVFHDALEFQTAATLTDAVPNRPEQFVSHSAAVTSDIDVALSKRATFRRVANDGPPVIPQANQGLDRNVVVSANGGAL